MKLSVYCDLRHIGWVITDDNSVVDKGIKRVDVDFDSYYEFIAGLPVSKRINRRNKRTARRNRWRRQSRRENLKKYLDKYGMTPTREYTLEEMLQLRVRALTELLQPKELGAVFLSMQKKRGYKNMRGLSNAETSDYLGEIKQNEDELMNYRSISEYLLNCSEKQDSSFSSKNIIFTRESYEKEFTKICKAQEIDDKKLFDLLYFQRPLSRGKIAYCSLEKNRNVCHYSHPDYQRFRILRDVNNIFIQDANFEDVNIPSEIRNKWAEKLMSGQNLTKASCCKDLCIKRSVGYTWRSGKQIQGNIVTPHIGNDYELWHDLFSAVDDAKLRRTMERKYPNENIDALMDVDFNAAGWGEFSHKAIMKLIPAMEAGMKLKEAILDVYGVVDMSDELSLRNLIVEQHFDSYSALIDALKLKYPITETVVEISHLLKSGNKGRKEMAKSKRKDEKRDKSFTDYQHALLSLHEEFKGRSPYEPDKDITKEELFHNYNIDHIVPKSKLFEHRRVNQCLCRRDLNEQKGSMTGIEFAQKIGIEDDYRKFIDNAVISEQKKRFMMMTTDDVPTNYVQADDYITRCFATKADYVIPNRIINKYYRDWKFNSYPENDVRSSLMKAFVLANFDRSIIEYFNNLKDLPNHSVGRYDLKNEIEPTGVDTVIPYLPRTKYYRKTKFGMTPRFQLHDESVLGKVKEFTRNTKGELVEGFFYKVRKPVASLTAPMIGKILDKGLQKRFAARFEGRDHADALKELTETPVKHNGKSVKSVSIRINANDLIKLERGYVYSAMNHRLNIETMKSVTMHQYMNDLNAGDGYTGKCLKRNDIVECDGKYFFVVGANVIGNMTLRSVYELDAKGIKANKAMIESCKIVRVNQTGVLRYEPSTNKKRLPMCAEDNRQGDLFSGL